MWKICRGLPSPAPACEDVQLLESTQSCLGPSLRVRGSITGNEELLIDGAVEGTIELDSKLIVGKTAKLKADIMSPSVVVSGAVKGDIRASAQIESKNGGSVVGNLTTPQILIEDGADFRGSIDIDRGADKTGYNNDYQVALAAVHRP